MKNLIAVLWILTSLSVSAQNKPFWDQIREFKKQDSIQTPPRNAIVFVGSSSFRLWKDMEKDFPDHVVINRGFGGSSLPHVIDYAEEIVIPYKPRQVVVYCGENDFTNNTVTSEIVTQRFIKLFNLLRERLPRVRIVFVSMKPSPRRQHLMSEMAAANESIRNFISKQSRASYVDIWDKMLDAEGAPRKELFVQDMLHMNADGYAIWREAIAPHLK